MSVIPAIDLIDGRCVRLLRGDFNRETSYPEDPFRLAARFRETGFDRLHVIDLDGARTGRSKNRFTIVRLATRSNLRLQVGGGIRTSTDVGELLNAGVQRLILGTAALQEPDTVSRWIAGWGADKFAVAIDLKGGEPAAQGWVRSYPDELPALLERIRQWGVRDVICTVVERDGTLLEPDYDTYSGLIRELPSDARLLAAGGVSRPEHVTRLKELGLEGAVVGKALYEGAFSLRQWFEVQDSDAG